MFAWFRRWRDERAAAKNAIATLVRMQIAEGLAPRFLTHKHPYKDDPQLTALMQDGLLSRAAFLQKPPALMKFYRRLLLAMEQEVTSVLEIGVKGGGSTALWKAIFPSATVVGLDIKLRRWLKPQPSADGVIYIEGD